MTDECWSDYCHGEFFLYRCINCQHVMCFRCIKDGYGDDEKGFNSCSGCNSTDGYYLIQETIKKEINYVE